jgi:carbonic anhydrase
MITRRWIVLALSLLTLNACKNASPENPPAPAAMTPVDSSPLTTLLDGNLRFTQGHPLHNNQDANRRQDVAQGQHPIAIIVGCSDSRVPPEIIFDQGLGDLFVVRVAGNVVDDHALGSIEYAIEHLHVGLVIVLGHDACGAVNAAVAGDVADAHIQSIVTAIQPAVKQARTMPGNLLDNAIDANVRYVVSQLKKSEPILSHEVDAGHLKIVGARYNLATGAVRLLTQ